MVFENSKTVKWPHFKTHYRILNCRLWRTNPPNLIPNILTCCEESRHFSILSFISSFSASTIAGNVSPSHIFKWPCLCLNQNPLPHKLSLKFTWTLTFLAAWICVTRSQGSRDSVLSRLESHQYFSKTKA